MSRTRRIVAGGAAVVGITIGAAAIAGAVTSQDTTPTTEAESDDVQDPQLDGSIQAPETEGQSEADEAAGLEGLATISPEDAQAAAIAAVPGTAGDAELENENGSVVYEVPITAEDGTATEVKVDAGNGDVLASETDDEGEEADEGDEADEADEMDEVDDDDEAESEDDEDESEDDEADEVDEGSESSSSQG
ncbi:MAG: DUF2613 family protein [Acidimicrobiales bacterium]|nr:DUF2613 family protein [Acidimicrobiales bacterium]